MKRLQPIWKEVTTRVPDIEPIGATARSLRLERGLTLQQVATSARMSVSQLSHLEHGNRSWSTRDLERISLAVANATLSGFPSRDFPHLLVYDFGRLEVEVR